MMEHVRLWLERLRALDVQLFSLGDTGVTVWGLLAFIGLIVLLMYMAGRMQRWMMNSVLARSPHLDLGMRQAISSVFRYVLILVGFLVIVQAFGINLTTLNVLVGAVGVGVGFGLQNIVSNWISGLIIMFERPVRVGNRIEVAGIEGDVAEIGARRTTLVTKDETVVIIPNQRLITDNVINWQYYHTRIPLRISLGVQHDADPDAVCEILRQVAQENDEVLKDPAPRAHLVALGGATFSFELIAWTTAVQLKNQIISALNLAINRKLAAANMKLG
jgi:small-conductance mechanosensitive channel